MLTKQEREEIKKRFDECSELDLSNMYKCLFGKDVSSGTSWVQDFSEMVDRIFELYDVSNMLELPVDKDGEVIRIGDTVYKGYDKYIVTGYVTLSDCTRVTLSDGKYTFDETIEPYYLTHKAPVTVKLLAQRIRNVLDDENTHTVKFSYVELNHIADIMESLADNDE